MTSWCHLAGRLPALDWVVSPVGAGGEEILGQGVVVLQQEAQPVGVHPPVPDVDVQGRDGPPEGLELTGRVGGAASRDLHDAGRRSRAGNGG